MQEVEKLKEEIGWIKLIFGILSAMCISIIAWIIENYDNKPKIIIYLSIGTIWILTPVLWYLSYKIIDKIRTIGEV